MRRAREKNETIWKIKFHCWISSSSYFGYVFSLSTSDVIVQKESLLTKLQKCFHSSPFFLPFSSFLHDASVLLGRGSMRRRDINLFVEFNLIFDGSWFHPLCVAKIDSINIDTSNGH